MAGELKKVTQTLCVIERINETTGKTEVSLGRKGRKLGAGYRSSPGGGVDEEKDKSIEDTAVRETKEEIGVVVKQMEKIGVLEFEMPLKNMHITMHIFRVTDFDGEPTQSEEMLDPRWYPKEELPIKEMWPDDEFWIPYYLEGGKFNGEFVLGENESVISHAIRREEGSEFKVH